jgi:hypothetical protein
MNQSRRLIIKDSPPTTAEKVSVPILPQVFQILSKSKKGVYRRSEEADRSLGEKCREKPAMTVKVERDTVVKFSIPILLFLGYLS